MTMGAQPLQCAWGIFAMPVAWPGSAAFAAFGSVLCGGQRTERNALDNLQMHTRASSAATQAMC